MKLINIIGIDGAGKTSLALNIVKILKLRNIPYEYKYCQYFAKLLYPLKVIAKLTIMKKTNEYRDYNKYNNVKKMNSSKHPILSNIYIFLWLLDYSIQIFLKIKINMIFGRKYIIDRYIFDIAINASLTRNKNLDFAQRLIEIFFRILPKPDMVIFIDLPEKIAMARKDDIPDIEYLTERRKRYLGLSKKYNFKIIDGTESEENVCKNALKLIEDNVKK